MKKLSLKSFIICAIVLYIIALVAFHLDYGYVKYEMRDESDIITEGTLIYLFTIGFIIGVIKCFKKTKNTKEAIEYTPKNVTPLEPTKEEIQTPTNVKLEENSSISNEENSRYVGTGIIGLKNYTDFCQIIGFLAILSGIICIVCAIGLSDYSSIFIILSIYLITGGIGCFILSALLKAIITITKAAKLYIDINQKEEKEEEK